MTRVVITGVGLVTPLGFDRETSWSRLLAGVRAPRLVFDADQQMPLGIGAPAWEPVVQADTEDDRDRVVRLALRAAEECVADADLGDEMLPRHRIGCIVGTSKGGLASVPQRDSAQAHFLDVFPDVAVRAIVQRYRWQGPSLAPVAACATGLVCLIRAAELIRDGVCDAVVAGSADASLLPIVFGSFRRLGVLAKAVEGDPAGACRPFDRDRSGFVVGEGAAMFCLEREEMARSRGATIYAEWLAGTLASDPTNLMHLDPAGESLTWLIGETLRRGKITTADLDYLNVHGTATQQNDLCETRAIRSALRTDAARVACSGQKGSIGHLLGAAGSVETAFALLALRDQVVPPTMNLVNPDPACDLDYTPLRAIRRPLTYALKLSLGFGGHLAAGLLRRWKA